LLGVLVGGRYQGQLVLVSHFQRVLAQVGVAVVACGQVAFLVQPQRKDVSEVV